MKAIARKTDDLDFIGRLLISSPLAAQFIAKKPASQYFDVRRTASERSIRTSAAHRRAAVSSQP
jgi:hypothetical protein